MIQIRWRKVKLSLSGRKPMSPKVRAIRIENLRYLMDFSINESPPKKKSVFITSDPLVLVKVSF